MTPRASKPRMSGQQRREQLIQVGRQVFAERGVGSATVEEIAAVAGVTKPLIYEHFGGKEGLYAVIVDREMASLLEVISEFLESGLRERQLVEKAADAILAHIEENPDGFKILVHDSPSWHGDGRLGTLMSDIAVGVEQVLVDDFIRAGLDSSFVPVYAQMLLGSIALTGEWWLEHGQQLPREVVAAHMANFAWNGLRGLSTNPKLPGGAEAPRP